MKKKTTVRYPVRANVEWKWMGRPIKGVVEKVYLKPVEREVKGIRIKRNGSPEKPAYLIRTRAGARVLKLQTELLKRA